MANTRNDKILHESLKVSQQLRKTIDRLSRVMDEIREAIQKKEALLDEIERLSGKKIRSRKKDTGSEKKRS